MLYYYDKWKKKITSENELNQLGLEGASLKRLKELGYYPLTIEKEEIQNPEQEGLKPDGPPMPDPDNPEHYIQKMVVYNFLDELKEKKLAALAQRRWDAQCANYIDKEGKIFKTTPEDHARMVTALLGVKSTQQRSKSKVACALNFKTVDGWVVMTTDEMQELTDFVATYTQDCYTNEALLASDIEAATNLDELNAVDTQSGWPENSFAPKPEYDTEEEYEDWKGYQYHNLFELPDTYPD